MRIRKHKAAFVLLLGYLPRILASDSSPLIPDKANDGEKAADIEIDNAETIRLDLPEEQIEEHRLKDIEQEDHDVPPTNQTETFPQQQEDNIISDQEEVIGEDTEQEVTKQEIEQTEVEPLARPQQQDNGDSQEDDEDRLASSIDYEDPQFEEEEQISDDYASSLATEDVEISDAESDTDLESNESDYDAAESTENPLEDTEEIASQAIQEDNFRLPALPKMDIVAEDLPDTEVTIDLTNHGDESSLNESEIISTDDSHVEEEPHPKEALSSIEEEEDADREIYESGHTHLEKKEANHDNLYKNGHTHVEVSETTKDQGLEEVERKGDGSENESSDTTEEPVLEEVLIEGNIEIENSETTNEQSLEEVVTEGDDFDIDTSDTKERLEEVVIEGDDPSFGSTGITNADEPEVDDEDIIVLNDSKMSIGTTSTEPIDVIIEEQGNGDGIDVDIDEDGPVIDGEILEESKDIESELNDDSNNSDLKDTTSLENATEEIGDETDQSSVSEPIESVDDNSTSDGHDIEVTDPQEGANNDSNTRMEQNVAVGDDVEASADDGENLEAEEKEVKEEKIQVEEEVEKEKENEEDKVEQFKDDDDEDDEDLAGRVSVDYASKSAGALIIEKTAEFKGTSNLITGDRDRYAIVPCSEEKKHVVLSLSEDILVKEIKLANYERFSSTVKDFQVKGSHTLGKWGDLGTFRAKSGNGEQTFVLETPGWARYLKFKFLTHHGNEWFCTLSQIKVHGSNMVQDFHEHWESIEEENKEEQLEGDQPVGGTETPNADESENSGTDTSTNGTARETKAETYQSNSSVAREEESRESDGSEGLDSVEKGDSGPRHAQVTPSVHSKLKPLDQFRSHMTFSEIIQVEMGDENLFSDLYNIIPHTLDSLPAHMKNDLTCKNLDHELRSVHHIGKLAMDSLYRFGTRIVDDFAVGDSRRIASAKMDDFSNEFYQKRFGSEISSLVHLYANNIVYPTSPSHIGASGDTITDSSASDGSDESSKQPNEDYTAELSLTDGKSSASTTNKEDSSAQANTKLFIEGNNDSLDFAIQKLLKDLPSAECLVHLDFAEFKNKFSTTRKSASASGGSQGGRMMEPIFKKLTDEIFALQTSLSVHDQFSKQSVSCYQRVILDLALETEKLRRDQDDRLRRLEEQILEPASMRMFQKLVVSLASSTATWLISNGSLLFLTIKNVWIPKLLKYYLSKDGYEELKEAFETAQDYSNRASNIFCIALDHLSQAIKTFFAALDSNGWANPETYQEYLSAWSKYYDGGMTVVLIVITLLFCRLIMMCSWLLRPKRSKKRSLQSIRNSRISNASAFPEEGLYATPSMATKKPKKKSSKNKRRSREQTNVPVVEDISTKDQTATDAPIVEGIPTKPSVESIPELKEEPPPEPSPSPKNNMQPNERENHPTANSPSVVSLEEE